jgi:hypothetical protein
MGDHSRVVLRRWVVAAVVLAQAAFVVRAYSAPHKEFGYQMFPEASSWRADIVRVTDDDRRVPVEEPWFGYEWDDLVGVRGLSNPSRRHHADAGLDNQLAFLDEALSWLVDHTPADTETRYYEATVTAWFNMGDAETIVVRSPERELP